MDWDRDAFARRLRDEAERHGFTLTKLAEHVDIAVPSISLWGGRSLPPSDKVYKVAQLLGIRAGYLLYGEGIDPEAEAWARVLRNLTPESRATVLKIAEQLAPKTAAEAPPVRPITRNVRVVNRRADLPRFKGLKRKRKASDTSPLWLNVAAGPGGMIELATDEFWYIPSLKSARGIHLAQIRGDSMVDTLQPGDVIVMEEFKPPVHLPPLDHGAEKNALDVIRRKILHGEIYALSRDGGQTVTIKRPWFQSDPGSSDWYLQIVADNPIEAPAYTVTRRDDVRFYARVIGLME